MRSPALLIAAIQATVLTQALNVSSTVKGTVTDQNRGVIPNAECTWFVSLTVLAGRYELF